MTWLKILMNIAKIRIILESVYLFLNKVNEPKDYMEMIKYVCIFQSGIEKVLTIMGSDVKALKEVKIEDIVLAKISKHNDIEMV